MKSIVMKSLVTVVLALGIGNYLVYLKTGQMPVMAMRDSLSHSIATPSLSGVGNGLAAAVSEAKTTLARQLPAGVSAPAAPVYKWTDEQGVVHFSDKPLGPDAEAVTLATPNRLTSDALPSAPGALGDILSSDETSPVEKARAAAEALNQRARQYDQEL